MYWNHKTRRLVSLCVRYTSDRMIDNAFVNLGVSIAVDSIKTFYND